MTTELQGLLHRLVRLLDAANVPFMIAGSFASSASPEDTIVAKLEWSKQSGGSERQRRDVAGIVATVGQELDRAYVERWVHDLDLADEWLAAQKSPI
jgi:hypothetical protein